MNITAGRLDLLRAQGLENAETPTIEAALMAQTRAIVGLWAGFTVVVGAMMACATGEPGVAAGGVLVAALLYALMRLAGRFRSEETATLRDKFITRKKRREYVVLGHRSIRVSRLVYDRMTPGARYRVHSNGVGAAVFDLEPLGM